MSSSIWTLPLFRNTLVADEPGPGRVLVDYVFAGNRVKYWRELRHSKTEKWNTFPRFPLVLNADGSPWAPACMWLLDRARARPLKVSSLNPIAQGLRAYRDFLDEYELRWDDFSADEKYLRPTYLYKTHLEELISDGAIKHSTAGGRMRIVIGFYRFLTEKARLDFQPLNPPWADRNVSLQYRDRQGFSQTKTVTTTDVSVKIPKRDYAWDRRIQDGGMLLPMSVQEQTILIKALRTLGNREYELMHYASLLTGARLQTVLTLRYRDFRAPPSAINQWPHKVQCGPGTGIDTKGDVPDVYLAVQRELYEWLHTYAKSDRAKARREKSKLKQDPLNYLFLTNQGGPYYESKDDINALRNPKEAIKRSSAIGQNVRSFIKEYVIPEIQKSLPDFHYQFHDLRATFGLNWVDSIMKNGDTQKTYGWARDQLRKLMWHRQANVTDRYLGYRQHHQRLETAEASWNEDLLNMIRAAGGDK